VGNGIAPQCARAAQNANMKNNHEARIKDPTWAKQSEENEVSQKEYNKTH
jgi:hypothetical protein